MSNSSLVNCTVKSPNHSGARTHAIDRITPHCVVGQLTAVNIGGCFTSSDRQASCNYGIGSDGKVCLVVDECNRSWCSSSNENDQRAVTIECASDKTDPYAFTDTVYNKLVELCVDICKRNGKTKLIWLGDKDKTLNYNPASDEMVLTVHRWFANKSCPGDWMYARMGNLAATVTSKLGGSTTTVADDGSMTDAEMYAYFKSQGLNDYGVSGLMGNLYAESALAANNLQNTGNTKLGMTDAEYTSAVDSGSYTNFVKDGYGYGLAQWTYYSRKQDLLDFMTTAGVSIGHKKKQCEFLIKELAGYASVLNTLKNAASVREASNAVLTGYEKPADQSESVQAKRAGYGQTYYDKYAANSNTQASGSEISVSSLPAVPFTVKVIINDLNYRSKGSMDGTINGQTGKGTFTIVEVNSEGWGKLKSGAGWIYLLNPSYCTIDNTIASSSSSGTGFVSYTVKVTTNLNIRKGPGTNYGTNGVIRDKGVYTIVAESDGPGASKWGKLKSGAGWISLDYCTRL